MRLPELGPERARKLRAPPHMACPFPAHMHPDCEEFENRVLTWMVGHRLLSDERQGYAGHSNRPPPGRLMGWLYPYGRAEAVVTGAQMAVWARMLDDRIADPAAHRQDLAEMAGRMLAFDSILHDSDAVFDRPDEPSEEILRDLCRRIRAMTTPDQWLRTQQAVLRAFLGFTADAAHASGNKLPTVARYRSIRRNTSTLDIFIVLAEVAAGFEVPPAAALRREVQMLVDTTTDLFTMAHDIFTCHKDVHHVDWLNFAILLAHEHARTPQGGLELAVEEFGNGTDRFHALSETLLDSFDHAPWARHLIRALEHVLGGYLAWLSELWITEAGDYDFGLVPLLGAAT
ncbi:terpene synthase family protein [Streptomyces mobaraensis]|uniref:Terpene synthase n=1 Tax=Streptomyces mobaraensis TaxID=35621 RepID=A0A5N5W9P7_STRMB|nr:hypothetical protein [Streptomyces mobaraensis]KAB7846859.1 hypothetical protein FRZ00_11625 [Streptomyces mobaraensis]